MGIANRGLAAFDRDIHQAGLDCESDARQAGDAIAGDEEEVDAAREKRAICPHAGDEIGGKRAGRQVRRGHLCPGR